MIKHSKCTGFSAKQGWIIALLLSISCVLHGAQKFQIDSVQFSGNERTDAAYLLPFVSDLQARPLDSMEVTRIVQRLVQLPQVYQAGYSLVYSATKPPSTTILIQIEEAKTAFPILSFGAVKGNVYTQVGWKDFNVLGQGISVGGVHQYDRRHSITSYLQIPQGLWNKYGYSIDFTSRHTMEPLFIGAETAEYKYDYNGGMVAINHAVNARKTKAEIGVGAFHERFKLQDTDVSSTFPLLSALPKALIKFRLQHQDLRQAGLQLTGVQAFAQLETVYTPAFKSWYHVFRSEWACYIQLTKTTNFAGRILAGIATNTDSPIAPFVLDSYVNIRGAGNIVSRGSASGVINLEIRQQVFGWNNVVGQVVAFSDYGAWRLPGGTFADFTDPSIIQHFVGGGIRVGYLKIYNATLRLDYGVDIMHQEKKGFVVGLAQYF